MFSSIRSVLSRFDTAYGDGLRHGLLLAALLLVAACATPLNGKPLTSYDTSRGSVREPQLVWNGSHFAVLYLWLYSSGQAGEIWAVKANRDGTQVAGSARMLVSIPFDPADPTCGSAVSCYQPGRISNLVWNPDDAQFAFAFSSGKAVWLSRLDVNLNHIYPNFIKIDFPNIPPATHPYMGDVSLVWNAVRKEYALTFIPRNFPIPDPDYDIYLTRIRPDGSFNGPRAQRILDCDYGCYRTSLACDTPGGNYAVAYYREVTFQGGAMLNARIGFLDNSLALTEHDLLVDAWPYSASRDHGAIRTIFDARANDYLVVFTDIQGRLNGRTIRRDGTPVGSSARSSTASGGFDARFSISMFSGAHAYMFCAADPQARCWLGTNTSQNSGDLFYSPDSVPRLDPSLVVIDDANPYVAWSQNGNLVIGPYSQ